jgi:hypothetical protein
MLLQCGPGKRLNWQMAIAVTGNVREASSGFAGLVSFRTTAQEQGSGGARMTAKKASEFEAGIAGRAENRGFESCRHQVFFKSARSVRLPIPHVEA